MRLARSTALAPPLHAVTRVRHSASTRASRGRKRMGRSRRDGTGTGLAGILPVQIAHSRRLAHALNNLYGRTVSQPLPGPGDGSAASCGRKSGSPAPRPGRSATGGPGPACRRARCAAPAPPVPAASLRCRSRRSRRRADRSGWRRAGRSPCGRIWRGPPPGPRRSGRRSPGSPDPVGRRRTSPASRSGTSSQPPVREASSSCLPSLAPWGTRRR